MAKRTGTRADDFILGTAHDDVLSGGGGRDVLEGGLGWDTLIGGSGDDALYGQDRSQVTAQFSFGESFPTVGRGVPEYDTVTNALYGGTGNDMMIGGYGSDRLDGGSGDDYASASSGDDTWLGGSGSDTLYIELSGADRIDGGSGSDRVVGSYLGRDGEARLFSVQGSNGVLSISGDVVATLKNVESFGLWGDSGDDRLDGRGASRVQFEGSDGDDVLLGSSGGDWLNAGRGNDRVVGGAGNDRIFDDLDALDISAGKGHDRVEIAAISAYPDRTLSGWVGLGSGSDTVDFQLTGVKVQGKVTVDGGSGSDLLGYAKSDSSADTVVGLEGVHGGPVTIDASGIDRLDVHTGSGKDTLTGGDYDDVLDAGTGADVVAGGTGNDRIAIANGGRADGGDGVDHLRLDLHDTSAGLTLAFSSGTIAVNAATSFANMETLDLAAGTGNDTITGGAGDDRLADGSGNDRLDGGAGNDTFVRGAADTAQTWEEIRLTDYATKDPGIDVIDGGAGFDTLSFAPHKVATDWMYWASVVEGEIGVDLANQALNSGLARGLTVTNVERIEGGVSDDVLKGSTRADQLAGGSSNDVLDGRGGNDVLEGGSGADELTGGAGRDQFVYGSDFSSPIQPYGFSLPEDSSGDHILDFTRGVDKLVFTAIEGATVRSGSTPKLSGHGPQFFFDTDTHELFYDSNGVDPDGVEVRVAVLDGVAKLDSSDFLFA